MDRDRSLLSDIRSMAAEAAELLSVVDQQGFVTDRLRQRALERIVMIAGEAASQLSAVSRASFAGVPWPRIIAMRHRLVHGYATISASTLYNVGYRDLQSVATIIAAVPFFLKICGISTESHARTALVAGASMIGFVFHPKSPRNVSLQQARAISAEVGSEITRAALLVDPDDQMLSAVKTEVRPDFLQLHGSETAQRVKAITEKFKIPVIKAIGVSSRSDLAEVSVFSGVADIILLDAKPPKDAAYPGGHGRAFDWSILKALDPGQPFVLSGGLTPDNAAEAIRTIRGYGLNLIGVDVSSGVESAPGIKDAARIAAFCASVRAAIGDGNPETQ